MRLALLIALVVVSWNICRVQAAPVARPMAAPADEERDKRIAALIEQLGDPQYVRREKAQQELTQLGLDAFEALAAARDHRDPEIAAQAQYLIRQIRFDWVRENDPPEISDILKDYEGQPEAMRNIKISQIASLADRRPLALPCLEWLCRLARFEESELLSKEAALKAMQQSVPTAADEAKAHFDLISTTVARGQRPAAQWLKTYVLESTDPAAAVEQWNRLITAEEQALAKPAEGSATLLSTLLRRQVGLLDRLKRSEESLQTISRLVRLERGETSSLLDLIDWLRERKAWSVIDEVASRFDTAIGNEPLLLYSLAQAFLEAGDSKRAHDTAARALKLRAEQTDEHYALANYLLGKGLKIWAEQEFRFVIGAAPLAQDHAIACRILLSEELHDQQREKEAAEVIYPLVEAADAQRADVLRGLQARERSPGALKSRMLYFEACDAQMKGDLKKQKELLYRGIAADPTDADVLIALYRYKGLSDEERADLKARIAAATEKSRADIEEVPEDPTPYNQMAWLVGNTEGNLEEAIKFSLKSIELMRGIDARRAGGYLDTLSHCYFAAKDYKKAVETQEEAVRLEPHSLAIARQLEVFRKALAEHGGDTAEDGDKPADEKKPAEADDAQPADKPAEDPANAEAPQTDSE